MFFIVEIELQLILKIGQLYFILQKFAFNFIINSNMPLKKHSQANSNKQQSQSSTFNKYILQQKEVINIQDHHSHQSQRKQQKLSKSIERPIKSKSKKNIKQKQIAQPSQKKQKNTERKKSQRKKKNVQITPKTGQIQAKVIISKQEDSAYNLIKAKYQQEESVSLKKIQKPSRVQDSLMQIDLLDKKKSKGKKQKEKQQIKIRNKYFSDLNVQDQSQADKVYQKFDEEKLELQIGNKTSTNYNTFQKIDKKIDFVKGRMEFKNQDNDLKFKKQLKKKLTQIEDAEQVQISIEVPTFFTNKSVSGALYMKNTHQSQQRQQTAKLQRRNSKVQEDQEKSYSRFQQPKNKNKKINRTDFFSQLNKQIKTKKQTSLSSQQIKQCFKTSVLDQKDNIDADEFENKDLTRRSKSIKSSIGQDSHSIRSNKSNQSSLSRNSSKSIVIVSKQKQMQLKDISSYNSLKPEKQVMIKEQIQSDISSSINQKQIQFIKTGNILKKETTHQFSHTNNQGILQGKAKDQEFLSISGHLNKKAQQIKDKQQIEKIAKKKIKEKKKQVTQSKKQQKKNKITTSNKFDFSTYFQQEAEASDDDDDNLQSQDEDQQKQIDGLNPSGDLQDLIDNSTSFIERNEHLVQRKFLQDQRIQDEIILNRIKNGIYKKVRAEQTESQKKLKKRMYQAAKRHQKQDLDQTQIQDEIRCYGTQIVLSDSQNQSQTKKKQKQLQKLQFELTGEDGNNKRTVHQEDLRSINQSIKNKNTQDPWKFLNFVMPAVIPKQKSSLFKKIEVKTFNQNQKPQQRKKSIGNRKSGQNKGAKQRIGNLNKLQKKKEIQLDFRDKNAEIQPLDFTSQLDI